MISLYTIFNFSIISAALMLATLGLWFAAILHMIDSWSKRFFITYFVILMLCCLVSLADMIIYRYVDITVEIVFGFFIAARRILRKIRFFVLCFVYGRFFCFCSSAHFL